jgi:ATPase subunit of ABC transporter with duplicated ATPase domains
VLKADSLCKAHDAEPLFADATFTLGNGDRAGLVGPNGTGKSTLLRILAGIESADAGSVTTGPDDRIGLLHQQAPDADLTVHDFLRRSIGEVYALDERMRALEAGMSRSGGTAAVLAAYGAAQERFAALDGWTFHAAIDDARAHLAIAHLPANARFRELSGGEQARVMLAGVLLARPTVLLLDEPTNHLDLGGLQWLERFLESFPGAVLVVSHDRRFLDNTVRRIFELDGVSDEPATYSGGYTEYRAEKQHRFERMLEEFRAQDRYRRQLEADIARTRGQALHTERTAGGPGSDKLKRYAKKVAKKAKARERRLRRQTAQAEWIANPAKAPSFTLSLDGVSTSGRRLALLDGAGVDLGGRTVLAGVDLVVKGRDRVAVVGENGAGKTTLLGLLAGELEPDRGRRLVDASVAVLPQSHHGLPLERGVLDFYRSRVVAYEEDARAFLGHFLFEQDQLHRPIGGLSPGERSRLLIAVLVSSGAELLLLDEPTNHLDFDSMDVVEEALRQFRGTIVAVTHDREFIQAIGCTRVVEVRGGRVSDAVHNPPRRGGEFPDSRRPPGRGPLRPRLRQEPGGVGQEGGEGGADGGPSR